VDDIEVDVAVVGGGGAGVVAALRASQNPGLVVGVFEKSTHHGSNTEISSGSLAAGGTKFQRAAGISDSPSRHAEEILQALADPGMEPIVQALCEAAPQYVEWIDEDLGFALDVGTDMPRAGMSVPRLHADVLRRGGGELLNHLRQVLTARDNVAFVDESPAVELITSNGGVDGVVVEQNGTRTNVHANTVVLATEGFAGNAQLMRQYCADLGGPMYCGASGSTGDAIAWLQELDVDFKNMASCLRHGQVVADHGTRVAPALPFFGAVLLNDKAERFVDEMSMGYSSLAAVIQQQAGERAVMVWDHIAMEQTLNTELMQTSIAAGAIRNFATVDELAQWLGQDRQRIEDALVPLDGRRALQPPYHAAQLTHGVLCTQGGAVIDESGHILRTDGSAVRGLRGAGGVAVGLSGPHSKGYSSGNGLLTAFAMGWIVGNELAQGA